MDGTTPSIDRQDWRLLPSEQVLWHGRPVKGHGPGRMWTLLVLLLIAMSAILATFAGLVWVAEVDGGTRLASGALLFLVTAAAMWIWPQHLAGTTEYLITDKRVHWRRGPYRRSIERRAITYARIRWHHKLRGVGDLELVRAAPFGPLMRQHRLTFGGVVAPDALYALLRETHAGEQCGDPTTPLIERLDRDESVVWGAHPEGLYLGWREIAIAAIGLLVLGVAVRYLVQVGGILMQLENIGLPTNSWTWVLFFLGMTLTFGMLAVLGGGLVWYGIVRARRLGRDTEYVLTDRRLLIRRGPTELSVDRQYIVDVAETKAARGLKHVFLVLDGPGSRALQMSGALGSILPSRDPVQPVLFELRDADGFRRVLFGRMSKPEPTPTYVDAA
jgi:hypothetical protein